MDFTVLAYRELLKALIKQGFSFLTFEQSLKSIEVRSIVLRHDVDALPDNSLQFARIQAELGIKGSYYFRIVPQSYDEKIICEIASMGHEIGYHYEDVSLAAKRQKTKGKRQKWGGFIDITSQRHNTITEEEELARIAIESFRENLKKLRNIVPVKTICMHGSPLSRWDSRLLWKYYDYHDFGIIGEPYFDIDFNKVFYLTDTGRRWDGDSFNIRDKAQGSELRAQGKSNRLPFTKSHTTYDIIKAAEQRELPDKIMMTFHPQRWTDASVLWTKELVWQNVKNVGKYFIIKSRGQ